MYFIDEEKLLGILFDDIISPLSISVFSLILSRIFDQGTWIRKFRRIVKFETLLNKNPPTFQLFIFLSKIREMKRSLKLKRLIKISTIAISLFFSWQKSSTN